MAMMEEMVCSVLRDSTESEIKKEKISILKNVIALSIAMTFLFTSYFSMENLQSSLNKADGTTSLAAIYASFILSSCLFATLLLRTIRSKYTLCLCSLSYIAYMMAQLDPKVYLLVPTAILLGLAAGPLWAAQGTYITKTGTRYAELNREDPNVVITRFFSIFFMFFQSTQVFGNLISSSVLSVGVNKTRGSDNLMSCGYRFCIKEQQDFSGEEVSSNNSNDFKNPSLWKTHALAYAYITGAVIASIIIVFILDPLHRYETSNGKPQEDGSRTISSTILFSISATFNHMRHPYQLLIIPLTIWSGIERAFIGADFTAAFVSCSIGIHMVGYTMICYGAFDVLGSISASHLVRVIGRVPVITLAFLINASVIITMVLWIPNSDNRYVFFIIAGLWGLADSVWMTQINSLYAVLFPGDTEPAFSNCRLWEATGFALSFGLSSVLCMKSKIIVIFITVVLGVIGYYAIELLEKIGGIPKNRRGKVVPIDRIILRRF